MNSQRLEIEKALYKRDINVALYHVEHSTKAKDIRLQLRDQLFENIKHIAQDKNKIRTLLMWTKNPVNQKLNTHFEPQDTVRGALYKKLNKTVPLVKAEDPNKKLLDETALMLGSQTVNDVDLTGYLQWVGGQGGQAALDKAGIEGTFVMTNQPLLDYFDDYTNFLVDTLDDTTKSWIASKIQYGRENFMSPDQIARMLIDDGQAISSARAMNIVVTESAKALTTVELKAMDSYGMEKKTWHTSEDAKVERICAPLDGVQVALNDSFQAGVEVVSGPPAHNFCRCFLDYQSPQGWQLPTNPWLGE